MTEPKTLEQNIVRSITATGGILNLLFAVVFAVFFDAPNTTVAMVITGIVGFLLYFASNTKHYRIVIHLVTAFTFFLAGFLIVVSPEVPVLMTGLLPVFMVNIFYRAWVIPVMSIVTIIVINVYVFTYLQTQIAINVEQLVAIDFLLVAISTLMMISSYQRQAQEHKTQERTQELARSEERFRQIVTNAPNLLIIYDVTKQQAVSWNKSQFMGFNIDEIIDGDLFRNHLHPDSRSDYDQIRLDIRNRRDKLKTYQLRLSHQDTQATQWVTVQVSTLQHDENHNICMRLITIMDVSARKQLEQSQLQQQLEDHKAELLTTMIRSFSHEFRTPLSVIETNLYLIRRKLSNPTIERHLTGIHDQSEHITKMVDKLNTLIGLKQQADLSLSRINIVQFAIGVLDNHKADIENKGLELIEKQPDDPLYSLIDIKLMTIVIDNILDNAIKFTPSGGTIRYSIEGTDKQIIIAIHDTGIGIPDDKLTAIYDLFTRLDDAHSHKGLGIGLSIAHSIVVQHGHHLEIVSEEGKGTYVTITLPRLGKPNTSPPAHENSTDT